MVDFECVFKKKKKLLWEKVGVLCLFPPSNDSLAHEISWALLGF